MANETVIETLISRFTGDATNYVKAADEVEKANKQIAGGATAAAKQVQEFSSNWREGVDSGMAAMERFKAAEWFKSLTDRSQVATTEMSKFGEEIKKWATSHSFLKGFDDLRTMFDKMSTALKAFASDEIPTMFSGAWAAASSAVVKSFTAIKVSATAAWAAVSASPLVVAGVVAMTLAAVAQGFNAFMNYRNEVIQRQQEFEQDAKDRAAELKETQKQTKEVLESAERAGPREGTEIIRKQLVAAGEEWETLNEQLEEAKKKLKDVQSNFRLTRNNMDFRGQPDPNTGLVTITNQPSIWDRLGLTDRGDRAREEAKAAEEQVRRINEQINTLNERLDQVGKSALANISTMRKQIEESRETLGMDETEKKIHSLNKQLEQLAIHAASISFKDPETEEEFLAQAQAWENVARARREVNAATIEAIHLEQEQKQLDFKNHLKETAKELERQVDVIGMSTKQLALYNAEQKATAAGTVLSDKDRAKLQELHDAVEAKKKLHDLEEKGKKLNKENAGPEEKYRNTVTELNTMLDKGYITQDTYNKAVEKAGKEFDKTGEKAKKAHNDIMKYEHALVGSLEASDRLEKQRTLFDEQGRDKRARPKVDSRLALDSALKDVETPKSRMEKEEKLMQQQNDWLMKIYEIMLQDEQDDEANQNFIGITHLEVTA